jgi:hypothetical protein
VSMTLSGPALLGVQAPRLRSVPLAVVSSAGQEAIDLAAQAGLHLDPWEQVTLIVHSAHEFKTAAEAFRRVLSLIENTPHLDSRVSKVTRSHGDEGVELKPRPTVITGADGRQITRGVQSRLRFFARTGGSGRGFSGDTVILDEAYNLPEMAISALMPIMATKSNPQLWYTSSAVDQTNPRARRAGAAVDGPPRLLGRAPVGG